MPPMPLSLNQWLLSRSDPVSTVDVGAFSMASAESSAAVAKQLQDSGLLGSNCACPPGRRFPLYRARPVRWTGDPALVPAVKKWLYECGLRFGTEVRVYYGRDVTIHTTWKMLIRWWPTFYWGPGYEECLVTDNTLQWALSFCHYDAMTFHHYRTRPKAGRKNWEFVLRVHQGLRVFPPDDASIQSRVSDGQVTE